MRKSTKTLIASALGMSLLSACGSGSPSEDTTGDTSPEPVSQTGELTTIRLAAVPVVDVAALYLGQEVGIFEDHGLELDIQFTPGSSVAIPGMLQDEFDVVYTGSVNAFQAREVGLPIVAIAEGGRTTGEAGKDHGGIIVPEGSDIQDAADLEGKQIAVNAVRGLHEVAVRQSVIKAGGDPDKVNFLELPLPDMVPALENGQIDAASIAEPFLGLGVDDGNQLIADPYLDIDPEFITATYLAPEDRVEGESELYTSFVEAVKESQEYAVENPDEFRTELSNFTEIDPDVAETMILTEFGWGFPEEAVMRGIEATAEAGVIEDVDKARDGLIVELVP